MTCAWEHPGPCGDLCNPDNAGVRLRRYMLSPGVTLGKCMAQACLSHEQWSGPLDWREVALMFAQQVDRLEKQAIDALTLAPPPIIIVREPDKP